MVAVGVQWGCDRNRGSCPLRGRRQQRRSHVPLGQPVRRCELLWAVSERTVRPVLEWGGTGNNTEVVYSLIPDCRIGVKFYLPSMHGFAFANHRPDEHITSITLPDPFGDILIGNAAWGLCGGMSFASRDYFEAGMWAPAQLTNPTGEGDPLFDYIVQRLGQSLNVGDAADFVKYADPVYPDTDDPTLGDGRDWVMAHVAFPAIRDVIDSGHPCPIGVVIGHLPNVTGLQRSPVQGRHTDFYSVRQFLAASCVKGPSLRTAFGHGGSLRQIMGV